jgi:hypothetical protein
MQNSCQKSNMLQTTFLTYSCGEGCAVAGKAVLAFVMRAGDTIDSDANVRFWTLEPFAETFAPAGIK